MSNKKNIEIIVSQRREIERRLRACLKLANENHDRFERQWYLRADEIDRLRARVAELEARQQAAEARVAQLEGALRTIAANTCCERGQEAALVARAALELKP